MSDVSDRHVRHTSRLRQTSSEGRQSKMSYNMSVGSGRSRRRHRQARQDQKRKKKKTWNKTHVKLLGWSLESKEKMA
jgi:hypothetical protein